MINIRPEVAGYYKMEAVNAKTGKKRLLADWFPNLITDNGLNTLGSLNTSGNGSDVLEIFSVGSGTVAPTNVDTSLASPVAITKDLEAETYGAATGAPYYGWRRVTRRFDEGVAAGNLSEVGVGIDIGTFSVPSAGPLFSRALILDGLGNPTTITVLADEFLDVTYELRLYAPAADIVANVTDPETSITHSVIIRPARVTQAQSSSIAGKRGFWGGVELGTLIRLYATTTTGSNAEYNLPRTMTGDIGLQTDSAPAGTILGSGWNAQIVDNTYSNNSIQRTGEIIWPLSISNGNVRSMLFSFLGGGTWQAQFDPAIVKTDTDILTFGITISWARHTP